MVVIVVKGEVDSEYNDYHKNKVVVVVVVMYLLMLVRLLKSNGFDIDERVCGVHTTSQHNDYPFSNNRSGGTPYYPHPTGALSQPLNCAHNPYL